jgi:hypothetical protein
MRIIPSWALRFVAWGDKGRVEQLLLIGIEKGELEQL